MTGKTKSSAAWHSATVVLREDIYRQALARGIDIDDACNRLLAGLTGSEYPLRQADAVPAPQPVIIARDGSSPHAPEEPKKGPFQKLHPVINADDPAAPARVVQAKAPVKKAPAEPPAAAAQVPAPAGSKEKPVTTPAATPKKAASKKGRAGSSDKKTKGDMLKTFFSSKIARSDYEGDRVGKDELYDLFARFCREHHTIPVPERRAVTVALKNQYALVEKMVEGTSFWTGIRLK